MNLVLKKRLEWEAARRTKNPQVLEFRAQLTLRARLIRAQCLQTPWAIEFLKRHQHSLLLTEDPVPSAEVQVHPHWFVMGWIRMTRLNLSPMQADNRPPVSYAEAVALATKHRTNPTYKIRQEKDGAWVAPYPVFLPD